MNLICPHCKAVEPNVRIDIEYLNGLKVLVLHCKSCGFLKDVENPSKKKVLRKKERKKYSTSGPLIPCTACGKVSVREYQTKTKLCNKCGLKLRNREVRERQQADKGKEIASPMPFIKNDKGEWINNPVRLEYDKTRKAMTGKRIRN